MMTPMMRSNFTDIDRREVGETMPCFADKKVRKMYFFGVILRPFARGHQTFAAKPVTWPYVSL